MAATSSHRARRGVRGCRIAAFSTKLRFEFACDLEQPLFHFFKLRHLCSNGVSTKMLSPKALIQSHKGRRSSSSSANCRMSLLGLIAFPSLSLASTILPLTQA